MPKSVYTQDKTIEELADKVNTKAFSVYSHDDPLTQKAKPSLKKTLDQKKKIVAAQKSSKVKTISKVVRKVR